MPAEMAEAAKRRLSPAEGYLWEQLFAGAAEAERTAPCRRYRGERRFPGRTNAWTQPCAEPRIRSCRWDCELSSSASAIPRGKAPPRKGERQEAVYLPLPSGEGWGEGAFSRVTPRRMPSPPALSRTLPEGEGRNAGAAAKTTSATVRGELPKCVEAEQEASNDEALQPYQQIRRFYLRCVIQSCMGDS